MNEIKLPPLPSPFGIVNPDGTEGYLQYTTTDLQDYAKAYARAAIKADRQARGEPVACRECGGNGAGGDHEDDCKYSEVPSKCSERPDPVLYAKIQTLRKYQAWRTGEDERTMDEAGIVPAEITSALDAVIKAAENYLKMETK